MISMKPSVLLVASVLLISLTASARPASSDYSRLYGEARTCYESGANQACDSLLAELMSLRLKRLQRRKVSSLLLDNAFVTDRREDVRRALDSRYVRRSLDRTDYRYWRILSELPPTEAVWPADRVTVPFRMVGQPGHALYGIDVSVNGKNLSGTLDNCASDYCEISSELAEELGVRPIGKQIRINGNKRAKSYIGIADSLSMGDLVVRNVLFSVSDSFASIAEALSIDLVIGDNVLRKVGDLVFDNAEAKVSFSKQILDLPPNVLRAYPEHDYYIDASLDGKSLTMLLDFGNTDTHMNARFLEEYPAEEPYEETTTDVIMQDRTWTTKSYLLKKAQFELIGSTCEWDVIDIRLEGNGGRRSHGSFGADMLHQYGIVVFNARHQYLLLIK